MLWISFVYSAQISRGNYADSQADSRKNVKIELLIKEIKLKNRRKQTKQKFPKPRVWHKNNLNIYMFD